MEASTLSEGLDSETGSGYLSPLQHKMKDLQNASGPKLDIMETFKLLRFDSSLNGDSVSSSDEESPLKSSNEEETNEKEADAEQEEQFEEEDTQCSEEENDKEEQFEEEDNPENGEENKQEEDQCSEEEGNLQNEDEEQCSERENDEQEEEQCSEEGNDQQEEQFEEGDNPENGEDNGQEEEEENKDNEPEENDDGIIFEHNGNENEEENEEEQKEEKEEAGEEDELEEMPIRDPYANEDLEEENAAPFWFGNEDHDQIKTIISKFYCFLNLHEIAKKRIREPKPFIGRITRSKVHNGKDFTTLDFVEIFRHSSVAPDTEFPPENDVWILTTWSVEEGIPSDFCQIRSPQILSIWKDQIDKHYEPSYLFCLPIVGTLDCPEFRYLVLDQTHSVLPISPEQHHISPCFNDFIPPKSPQTQEDFESPIL